MQNNKESFLRNLQEYIYNIENFFESQNIYLKDLQIDHICYKCGSAAEFEEIRRLFEFDGSYIYQAIISKRRIATIGFKKPLKSVLGYVYTLELSDQKPDFSQYSKIDHVEFYSTKLNYEDFKKYFADLGFSLTEDAKPHHTTFNFTIPGVAEIKLTKERLVDKVVKEILK